METNGNPLLCTRCKTNPVPTNYTPVRDQAKGQLCDDCAAKYAVEMIKDRTTRISQDFTDVVAHYLPDWDPKPIFLKAATFIRESAQPKATRNPLLAISLATTGWAIAGTYCAAALFEAAEVRVKPFLPAEDAKDIQKGLNGLRVRIHNFRKQADNLVADPEARDSGELKKSVMDLFHNVRSALESADKLERNSELRKEVDSDLDSFFSNLFDERAEPAAPASRPRTRRTSRTEPEQNPDGSASQDDGPNEVPDGLNNNTSADSPADSDPPEQPVDKQPATADSA